MTEDKFQYYIRKFQEGDVGTAFHCLLENRQEMFSQITSLFHATKDRGLRTFLAEVIRRMNDPLALPYLIEAIHDTDPDVWKEGMDGLVALASQPALDALRSGRDRQFTSRDDAKAFCEWLDEAIEQLHQALKNKSESSPKDN